MSGEVVVAVQKRDLNARTKDIRKNSRIPAVAYGHNVEPIAIDFDYQEFRKAYRKTGDSTLMYIELDGKKYPTLVHDVQYHPVSDQFTHVDFYIIDEKEPVKAHIHLIAKGLSPAVKNLAGVLSTPQSSIEIKCLPKYLMHDIVIDVTGIEDFHSPIHVKDLAVFSDQNIEILTDPEAVVAVVNAPKGGDKKGDSLDS